MTQNAVTFEKQDNGIAIITLQNPKRLNALSGPMLDDINQYIDQIAADDDIRIFLLCGAAREDGRPCFSAGVDVQAFADNEGVNEQQGFDLCNRIDDLLKPSIAVIDGVCSTGGAELALACDLRLVANSAKISEWHLKHVGIGTGSWGASTRWAREVGVTEAKHMMLTGRVIDGDEAVRIGFASACYPSENLQSEAQKKASEIAAMNPNGVRGLLAHIDRIDDMSRDQALRWAQLTSEWMGLGMSEQEFVGMQLHKK